LNVCHNLLVQSLRFKVQGFRFAVFQL
jgi:hypothetical protein